MLYLDERTRAPNGTSVRSLGLTARE